MRFALAVAPGAIGCPAPSRRSPPPRARTWPPVSAPRATCSLARSASIDASSSSRRRLVSTLSYQADNRSTRAGIAHTGGGRAFSIRRASDPRAAIIEAGATKPPPPQTVALVFAIDRSRGRFFVTEDIGALPRIFIRDTNR